MNSDLVQLALANLRVRDDDLEESDGVSLVLCVVDEFAEDFALSDVRNDLHSWQYKLVRRHTLKLLVVLCKLDHHREQVRSQRIGSAKVHIRVPMEQHIQ